MMDPRKLAGMLQGTGFGMNRTYPANSLGSRFQGQVGMAMPNWRNQPAPVAAAPAQPVAAAPVRQAPFTQQQIMSMRTRGLG
jgi:hypothetical protein